MGNWDIKPALYDNEVKNCLVATYGIQGLAEKHDFFGYLDVYFNYDEYYGAAEPPVRCGESHLSGLTEPLRSL